MVEHGEKEKTIKELRSYVEKRGDIVMAFLFGSRAKGYARRASDWDIGVYFAEGSEHSEGEVWTDIEKIVGAEADMVVLNRAPANVAWSIMREVPLVVKDRNLYLRLLTAAGHEANDWYRTAEDYHRVFERSRSLLREDRSRLERIVQFLATERADFAKFKNLTWEEYQSNSPKRREVERWAEQLVNAVIDSAEIILASEKRVIPENYREIVRQLGPVTSFGAQALCERLTRWVKLRNVLAHEYLDYRWRDVSAFVAEAGRDIEEFLAALRAFLSQQR